MNIYTWTKDWESVQLELYGEPFLAVDPGKTGAAICCEADGSAGACFSLKGLEMVELAREMSRMGIKTIIMEDQYVGRNPRTVMLLRLAVGIFLGRLEEKVGPLDVVFTEPKTWQAVVLPGFKGREALKEAAELLVRQSDSEIPDWTKGKLEGFWDADCIREWWKDVSRPEEGE